MNPQELRDPHCCALSPISRNGLTITFANNFETDWHPNYGDRLGVFPRSLVVHDGGGNPAIACWPDLATLVEDDFLRQIAYYPAEQSSHCLRLAFDKDEDRLDVWFYEDDRILLRHSVSNLVDSALRAEELL